MGIKLEVLFLSDSTIEYTDFVALTTDYTHISPFDLITYAENMQKLHPFHSIEVKMCEHSCYCNAY